MFCINRGGIQAVAIVDYIKLPYRNKADWLNGHKGWGGFIINKITGNREFFKEDINVSVKKILQGKRGKLVGKDIQIRIVKVRKKKF